MEALERKAQAPGDMAYNRVSRESARRLLPLVHFMGTYGLRIGDVLTVSVKLEEGDRFSYRQKGGEVRQKALRPYITGDSIKKQEYEKTAFQRYSEK